MQDAYDKIVDDTLSNKLGVGLDEPDRRAKYSIYPSQLTNLLDCEGYGFIDLENQRMETIKQEQVHHKVLEQTSTQTGPIERDIKYLQKRKTYK